MIWADEKQMKRELVAWARPWRPWRALSKNPALLSPPPQLVLDAARQGIV
jgi:hypothetical protein